MFTEAMIRRIIITIGTASPVITGDPNRIIFHMLVGIMIGCAIHILLDRLNILAKSARADNSLDAIETELRIQKQRKQDSNFQWETTEDRQRYRDTYKDSR